METRVLRVVLVRRASMVMLAFKAHRVWLGRRVLER